MAVTCGTISEAGVGTFTVTPTVQGSCIELLDAIVLYKNGLAAADPNPSWFSVVEGTGSTAISGDVVTYSLPLTFSILTYLAWPIGSATDVYTIRFRVQETTSDPSSCAGQIITCEFPLALATTNCQGSPRPDPTQARVAFITATSPSDLWSALITGSLSLIRTGIEWSGGTYAALGLMRIVTDLEDAIIFMTDENGSVEVRRIGFDGAGEVLIATPGSASLNEPALMVTFPSGNVESDIAYWFTARRGWTPVSGPATNWSTSNFAVSSMAAYDAASADDNMIVRNSGSNPFDLRDYKDGTTIVNTTGTFNKAIKSNRDRTRVFGLNADDLIEINPITLATISTNALVLPGTSLGLIGVDTDANRVYVFESDSGIFVSTCQLNGTFVEKVFNLTALGLTPSNFSGVLF